MMETVETIAAIRRAIKSSPPTNQHLTFYRPDALPVAQPTISEQEGKISHSTDVLTPSSSGDIPTL